MFMSTARPLLRLVAAPLLALALFAATPAAPAFADRYDHHDGYDHRRGGYNDEYIFVATRTLSDADVHPAAKVPLFPVTIILDLVALPVEVIAGLF
jgi:hypothetical protein